MSRPRAVCHIARLQRASVLSPLLSHYLTILTALTTWLKARRLFRTPTHHKALPLPPTNPHLDTSVRLRPDNLVVCLSPSRLLSDVA